MSLFITTIVLFAATNIDDIFLLLAWFSQKDSNLKVSHIIIGQYLGFIALVLLSLIGALGSLVVAQEWIGLLGLVPIYLGLKAFVELFKEQEQQPERDGEVYTVQEVPSGEKTEDNPGRFKRLFHPSIYKVAAVTFANGGDNIGVYVPFLATYKSWQIGIIVIIFLFLVAVWCYVAKKLVAFPMVAITLERYGHIIVPFVLVGIGILIIIENDTFSFFIDKLL